MSNSLPVIIIGAGGHAKVLAEALKLQSTKVLEMADQDEAVLKHPPASVRLVNGIGSVDVSAKRRQVFEKFKKLGYVFLPVVHSSAIIASDFKLAEGVQIMAGAVVQPGTVIGENSIINTRAGLDHDCLVGAHVHIAPGVTLSGNVTIGEGAHVGVGANIIQGIRIGKNAVVAAGSLVHQDVEPGSVVMGVPARNRGAVEEEK